jgi:uncharacterized protein YjbJ (UPF0337 family)
MVIDKRMRSSSQVIKGKLKSALGRALGSRKLKSQGEMDQVKGNLKGVAEKVKHAFKK